MSFFLLRQYNSIRNLALFTCRSSPKTMHPYFRPFLRLPPPPVCPVHLRTPPPQFPVHFYVVVGIYCAYCMAQNTKPYCTCAAPIKIGFSHQCCMFYNNSKRKPNILNSQEEKYNLDGT
jgi:hypothetical protein